MKALSVRQPWASLIATGDKRIEVRSWPTNYRGPLAIQAAKRWTADEDDIIQEDNIRQPLQRAGLIQVVNREDRPARAIFGRTAKLPLGQIIAVVELLGCEQVPARGRNPRLPPQYPKLAFGDIIPGSYGWLLGRVIALGTPIPYQGRQGLWTLEPDVVEQIAAQAALTA